MIKHLKTHVGKYASIVGVFPLIFLANIAMPDSMSFATADEVNETQCKLAWIAYERGLDKLDSAEHRAEENSTERNRKDVVRYKIEVDKALADIKRYCKK